LQLLFDLQSTSGRSSVEEPYCPGDLSQPKVIVYGFSKETFAHWNDESLGDLNLKRFFSESEFELFFRKLALTDVDVESCSFTKPDYIDRLLPLVYFNELDDSK
jgi:hypothetical protein